MVQRQGNEGRPASERVHGPQREEQSGGEAARQEPGTAVSGERPDRRGPGSSDAAGLPPPARVGGKEKRCDVCGCCRVYGRSSAAGSSGAEQCRKIEKGRALKELKATKTTSGMD